MDVFLVHLSDKGAGGLQNFAIQLDAERLTLAPLQKHTDNAFNCTVQIFLEFLLL